MAKNKNRLIAFKQYNFKEFDKILRNNGWELVRTSGDHHTYSHKDYTEIITIPYKKEVNKMMCLRYTKTFNLCE